jgi:single-strand DNA-binding protein
MNSVVLIGRLTKDPEVRYIPESQKAVATFTLAVDRPYAKEKTADFIRIKVFGKTAENCERYLVKGRLVGIQGRIQTGSFKNKEGDTVYTTDVVADRVEFLERGDQSKGKDPNADFRQTPGIPEGFQALEDEELDDDSVPF